MHALIISRYVKTVADPDLQIGGVGGGGWGGGEGGYPDPEISGCLVSKKFFGS